MNQGLFIALEGDESSNTAAQFHLIKERLTAIGHDVVTFKFPSYENESGHFIKRYLGGFYGPIDGVSPYSVSLFYALDRYDQAVNIKEALAQNKVVLVQNYVGTTMASQAKMFGDQVEQRGFFVWADSLEYQLLGIPRPNMSVLIEPVENSGSYKLLASLFPQDFTLVETRDGQGADLSVSDINNKVWEIIKPRLPQNAPRQPRSMTIKLSEAISLDHTVVSPASSKPKNAPYESKLSLLAIAEASFLGLEILVTSSKWASTNYSYYRPSDLPKKLETKYNESLDKIVKLNKKLFEVLKKSTAASDLTSSANPLAAQVSIRVAEAPGEQTAKSLSLSANAEIRKLHNELTKHYELENLTADDSSEATNSNPEPIENIISKLVDDHLPNNLSASQEPVKLVDFNPKNEFKLVSEVAYPLSNVSKTELAAEIDSWSYEKKSEVLEAALKTTNIDLFKKITYEFDVTSDRILLNEFMQAGLSKKIRLQPPTPRYGYEVPKEVDEAGITDEYLDCFDESLELFSSLQAAGKEYLAGYSTLIGHKGRYQLSLSLWDLHNLQETKTSARLKDFLEQCKRQISEHHPIIALSLDRSVEAEAQPARTKPEAPKSAPRRRKRRRGGKDKK